ncbi:AAC(3) family N-acetyltransferase [Planotetraspora sp. A-T 1434]|uniref:aminoglycoside N(3)-acetyltransferase n=1 Tax=Planotetraspora sp. A-T 1434 TaxID=2979219 RepID=UPI0021C0CF93|nr:AAC(3) family N-acetyltransferase [Planotetraspora sp. A-T 1434]MCT9934233.1 AAC(3) family N-acetyltransferase [Planotetraspora sp. A-T 1434]
MEFTVSDLARDLRALGVRTGQTLLLHASLSAIGGVRGGAATVVTALRDVLGPDGTLVVPVHTADNSETSPEHLRAIRGMTEAEVALFRRRMPAFDPLRTPSTGMGRIAEHVRTTDGAVRSAHPQTSFAAVGPRAAALMADHAPDCHLGEKSPLARLYKVQARVLLLGVGYDRCTAFHLGEYRCPKTPPRRFYRCVVNFGHGPQWWEYEDVDLTDHDFRELGEAFEKRGAVDRGWIGKAGSRVFPVRAAVEFAAHWLAKHRHPYISAPSGTDLTYAAFP